MASYEFNISTGLGDGDLTVTTSDTATNSSGQGFGYAISAISGTFAGQLISGEYGIGGANPKDSQAGTDNTVFIDDSDGDGGSHFGLDRAGIGFMLEDGSTYTLYYGGGVFVIAESDGNGGQATVVSHSGGPPDLTFHYHIDGADGASGDLVVTAESAAVNSTGFGAGYNATAISGSFDGKPISGILGKSGVGQSDASVTGYDNAIFVDDSVGTGGSRLGLDSEGIAFTTSDGEEYAAFYYNGGFGVETNSDQSTAAITSPDAPCFCAGSRIRTARGDVAVEHLAIGDKVATFSGALRPIRWIGHCRIDARRHPRPQDVWPVRISAGAFGDGLPVRDLWVSPEHCIASGGALAPAKALVNGATVRQIEAERVDYWHVELDAHDVIFAEGLPTESYLDTGNRSAFDSDPVCVALHSDFQPRHWTQTCLPLALDGPRLAEIRSLLLDNARALGHEIVEDDDAHLIADGERIEPNRSFPGRLSFAVPEGRGLIVLRSRVFVPAQILPDSRDERCLGLCVGAIEIDGEPMALDATFAKGWHLLELNYRQRWTNGAGELPGGSRKVTVDLVGRGRYWLETSSKPKRRAA